jgi:beta-galactosidase
MTVWNRRDLLKGGLAAWVGSWLPWLRRSWGMGAGLAGEAAGAGDAGAAGAKTATPAGPATAVGGEARATTPELVPGRVRLPDLVPSRERLLLDFGWRFSLGHADDPDRDFGFGRPSREGAFAKSGELFEPAHADFDAGGWETIDLPHDWAVRLPFVDDRERVPHGAKPLGRGYPATSIGWYRRVFQVSEADLGRRLEIQFDGVFRDCMVVLNGFLLGRHASGYSPFRFDITDFVNSGANVLVVRADATENEGWFYEGAGIYRHVWLEKTGAVHVANGGTFVAAELRGGRAELSIDTEVRNDADEARACRVFSSIVDGAGDVVASTRSASFQVPGRGRGRVAQHCGVAAPRLWSLETPQLYRLVTVIEVDGAAADRYETSFGIRSIHHDPDRGFFLNGKPVKVQGTCNHQDHAGVGSALPDALQSYRVARLKAMGCNAYRTSHNPPTPELLDACDRLGMLVMDETRTFSSDPEALADLEVLVRRDRNHPSVIWWSIGNEEPAQGTDRGARIADSMKRLVRRLDPTRPVTMAMNGGWGHGASAVLDVQGFNYGRGPDYDAFHKRFPHQPTLGSETASTVATRGIYANDPERGYVSAYDVNRPSYAATAEGWWTTYAARPFLAGGFAWTGFDYRGEPSPYNWPCISSHFGILDTCGFPKDSFYYYQAWWRDEPVLHLFPHWNWPGREGQPIDVWCHSNLDRIELFLNGDSLGARDVQRLSHVQWSVAYAPGVLEARGYRGGRQVLVDRRETTGGPAAIVLRADRSNLAGDGEDCTVVEAHVVDAQGRLVPEADNEIAFVVTGPGRIIGVGNGDPSSHEPDVADRRRAFNGLCVVIVQATKQSGELRIEASSPGLRGATAAIQCSGARPRPAAP